VPRAKIKVSEIRRLAILHCTEKEASGFFGITVESFRRILKHDSAARRAWEEGQANGKIGLRRKQFRLADTSAPMAIFLGKQYLGQSDVIVTEHSGRDGGPIETKTSYDVSGLSYEECKQLKDLLTRTAGGESDGDPEKAG
jgi:hypothetical protein